MREWGWAVGNAGDDGEGESETKQGAEWDGQEKVEGEGGRRRLEGKAKRTGKNGMLWGQGKGRREERDGEGTGKGDMM